MEAREVFQFSLGDKVHVLSDKAFRKSREDKFEAVGNVIITHKNNAIYGEKASLSFKTGDTDVVGNVRYVGPTMTLYGSQLHYNINTNLLRVENARVLSDNYVVLGKEISRVSENEITAVEAEYTTCRDCPESWSVYGQRVHIQVGEYVRIWNAFIKVKGVVIMYVPYIILPIKKNRESGLLFPSFGFEFEKGMRFQQPWFWAIGDSADMTITPSVWGVRGIGGELEYRQMLGDMKWFEVEGLFANDRVYEPGKIGEELSGFHTQRYFGIYEHHFNFGHHFSNHVYFTHVNDMDMQRDYDFFADDKVFGSEYGGGGFFNWTTDLFDINLEGDFNRNQLISNPKAFDHDYVQVLPELDVNLMPVELFSTDIQGFRKLSIGGTSNSTLFRQNRVNEGNYIRNAWRTTVTPYLDLYVGTLGPVQVKTRSTYDFQYYRFQNEPSGRFFRKSAHIQETEFSVDFEKVFGLAFQEEVPIEDVDLSLLKEKKIKKNILDSEAVIGKLPKFESAYSREKIKITRNSYKHAQNLKLKHYLLSNEQAYGNENFRTQILTNDGQFDSTDGLKEVQHEINRAQSRTGIPLKNTIEFQWNNSVIRKSSRSISPFLDRRYPRDNFDYTRVSYFNVSQGYEFDTGEEDGGFEDSLTRLFVNTGLNLDRWSLSASEYYFYATNEHLVNFSTEYRFDKMKARTSFIYDSFTTPVNKQFLIGGTLDLSDLLSLSAEYVYDIEDKQDIKSRYGFLYSPYNNCWKLDLAYEKNLVEKQVSFNFLINFNENSFTSLSGMGGE